jgi:cellulose synthase/poly-beta-1,6-N-acetylglucosamine synthase-like glycosyltransferase
LIPNQAFVLWFLLAAMMIILAYTYVGYPLLVKLLKRAFVREIQRANIEPSVSLIIAAMNEEGSIAARLDNALAQDYPPDRLEIVVASDGSTDRTDEIVRSYSGRGVRLFATGSHHGKTGTANRTVPSTRGEVLVFSDATGRFRPGTLRALVRNFADPTVGAVSGRVVYHYGETSAARGFEVYQRYVTSARRAESAFGTETSVSGSIHAVRRDAFLPAPPELDYDMVHPLHVAMKGWRTVYEAEAICEEDARADARGEFNARCRMAIQAYTFLPYLLRRLPRCRKRIYVFQVLSHKVLRWLSPLLLLSMLVLSTALALLSAWAWLLLAPQLAVYGTAATAYVLRGRVRAAPVLGVPLFFTTINLAFFVGFLKWARGERRGAWKPER